MAGKTVFPSRKPTLPGTLLLEHYLRPREISIMAFAEAVGYSRKHISEIIHGHKRIEAELAARIATVLGTTPLLWLNAQNAVDLWHAAQIKWKPKLFFFADKIRKRSHV